jgi:hypothetical protein
MRSVPMFGSSVATINSWREKERRGAPLSRPTIASLPPSLVWLLFLVACAGAFVVFAVSRGQDVNFDQLNYHTYSAYAFLHSRLDVDAAPAQIIHSYFNPLANLLYYVPFRRWGPVAACVVVSTVQALNLVLVALIGTYVCRDGTSLQRWLCVGAAVAVSVASPMALSEIGTSFTDTLTSIPVLATIALLLRTPSPHIGRLLICGVLVGCAVALKLTNGTFAVGLAGTCVFFHPNLVSRLRALAATSASLLFGFLLVGGPWCLLLWKRFRNPVFPYYNTIFRSPDFPPTSDIDRSHLPTGVIDGLAYPFRWAVGIVPKTEFGFHDIRFAVIIVLLALCGLIALSKQRAEPLSADGTNVAGAKLIIFCGLSFVVWLTVFAIQRYVVTLELLCGPVASVAIGWLVRGRIRVALGWALAAAAGATVTVPDWSHVPFLPGMYGLQVPPSLQDDGLFLMAGAPVSYLIPSFSEKARFFGIMDWEETMATAGTTLTRRILQAIDEAGARKLRVIANSPMTLQTRLRLGSYGLQPTGQCQQIPGYSPFRVTFVCDLVRIHEIKAAALILEPKSTLDFRDQGRSFLALSGPPSGVNDAAWHFPGPIADLRGDHRPTLYFRRSQRFGRGAMRLHLAYRLPVGDERERFGVTVIINGVRATQIAQQTEASSGMVDFVGCVPASSAAEADDALNVVFQADVPSGRAPAPDALHFQLLSFMASASGDSICR